MLVNRNLTESTVYPIGSLCSLVVWWRVFYRHLISAKAATKYTPQGRFTALEGLTCLVKEKRPAPTPV